MTTALYRSLVAAIVISSLAGAVAICWAVDQVARPFNRPKRQAGR